MGSYSAREDDFFQIAAFADQVFHRVAVRDAHHILFDDGTIVEHFGDVVTGGADQLDAALERLMVGTRAHKSWKKRMVNIDNALRIFAYELVRENLHVARQHHKVWLVLVNQVLDSIFGSPFVVFHHRNDYVRNLVEGGDLAIIRMVGDNQRNLAGEFAALMPIEQIH